MISSKSKNRKAFTIIEVVLVLAIAGLIILMALLLLPNAARMVRNNQRKEDMSRLLKAIDEYIDDNGGVNPMVKMAGAYSAQGLETAESFTESLLKDYMGLNCFDRSSEKEGSWYATDNDFYAVFEYGGGNGCSGWEDPMSYVYGIDYRPSGRVDTTDETGDIIFEEKTVLVSVYNRDSRKISRGYYGLEDSVIESMGYNPETDSIKYSSDYEYAMTVFSQSKCGDTESYIEDTKQSGDVAIFMVLEGGAVACVDNSGGKY